MTRSKSLLPLAASALALSLAACGDRADDMAETDMSDQAYEASGAATEAGGTGVAMSGDGATAASDAGDRGGNSDSVTVPQSPPPISSELPGNMTPPDGTPPETRAGTPTTPPAR